MAEINRFEEELTPGEEEESIPAEAESEFDFERERKKIEDRERERKNNLKDRFLKFVGEILSEKFDYYASKISEAGDLGLYELESCINFFNGDIRNGRVKGLSKEQISGASAVLERMLLKYSENGAPLLVFYTTKRN